MCESVKGAKSQSVKGTNKCVKVSWVPAKVSKVSRVPANVSSTKCFNVSRVPANQEGCTREKAIWLLHEKPENLNITLRIVGNCGKSLLK